VGIEQEKNFSVLFNKMTARLKAMRGYKLGISQNITNFVWGP
jgi:hypothetical protein